MHLRCGARELTTSASERNGEGGRDPCERIACSRVNEVGRATDATSPQKNRHASRWGWPWQTLDATGGDAREETLHRCLVAQC